MFFLQAAVFGAWLPRIADVKINLGLSEGALGLVLLSIPAGTFAALTFGGPLVKKLTPALTLKFALALWAWTFVFAGMATNAYGLAFALCAGGLILGLLEIASNVEADSIEQQINKRIMSRCHGFWSLGAMTGALLGGPIFANQGVSVLHQFYVLAPIATVLGIVSASFLTKADNSRSVHSSQDDSANKPRGSLTFNVFMLCLIPIGIMAIEGSIMDWSAVFMREQMNTDARIAGYTFAMFAAIMAVIRLAGDWIGERFGATRVVQWSGLAAAVGIALFATASHVWVALIGAALAGAGVAIVYPLTMTAVARVDASNREANVAYLSIAAFSIMMLTPPLLGGIAEVFDLRIALLCLLPGAILTVVLAKRLSQSSMT